MNVIQALYDQIEELRNDYINGSSAIALHALDIITAAIDLKTGRDMSFPRDVAEKLIKAKPSMSAIATVVRYAMKDYSKSVGKVKKYFCNHVRERFLQCTEDSIDECFRSLFRDKSKKVTVITCSYSNNVSGVLIRAYLNGFKLKVYTLQSLWRDRDYADVLASVLNRNGIMTEKISLKQLSKTASKADFALIGCDGMNLQGRALNGLPSLEMAKSIYNFLPLYIVGESFKKTDKLLSADGFEIIPAKYIKKIFSDTQSWI